jgi:hypothetical protein
LAEVAWKMEILDDEIRGILTAFISVIAGLTVRDVPSLRSTR